MPGLPVERIGGALDPLKILAISSWAPPTVGGPQFLYNLFSRFRADSYTILTSASLIDHRSGTEGNWLPGKYVFYDRKGGWTGKATGTEGPGTGTSIPQRMAGILAKVPLVGQPSLEILGLSRAVAGFVVSAFRIIRSSKCNVILGFSDWGPALLGMYIVHRITGVPYAVYYFDLYGGNLLSPVQRLVARHFEPRLLERTSAVILTNEGTERYLRRRFGDGHRYEVVPNSVLPESYGPLLTPFDPKPPYEILYTGQAYWPQEGALLNMIHAMDRLRDIPVRFHLHIPIVPESIRQAVRGRPNVHLTSEIVPLSEMPRMQCNASLLFLPLSWNTKAPDIIATASPGKLSEYLASGRPMLVHGPEDSFVARFTREHGTGIVVDRDDVEVLAGAVRRFCQEPAACREGVERALRIFAQRHDARRNAAKLWGILTEIGGRERAPSGNPEEREGPPR